jgi:hypothetical protein
MADRGWWRCPNDPPCPHAGIIHDIHDAEDLVPRCCAEDCDCGKDRAAYLARMLTLLDGFTAGGTDG